MPDRIERDKKRLNDRQPNDKLPEYEGGYGGGRNRAVETPDHRFGERGWSGGRAPAEEPPRRDAGGPSHDLPEGERDAGPDDSQWQERYVRENSDKYGQWGGQPIRPRGAGSSMGGYEHREQSLGSINDLSPRGAYGARETERWPLEGKYAGKGPRSYKSSDERIREDVCQRLTDHPAVDASEIEVAVRDGEVTLTGTIEDRRMKRIAEAVAAETAGVLHVHNQIRAVPHG
jgi:osmotically-inducible protein OsmY